MISLPCGPRHCFDNVERCLEKNVVPSEPLLCGPAMPRQESDANHACVTSTLLRHVVTPDPGANLRRALPEFPNFRVTQEKLQLPR